MSLNIDNRIVILDRDGVINVDSDQYIKSPEEWRPIPGSIESIAKLNQAGFRVFVITNQSGVAREYFSIETLHRIHQKMHDYVDRAGGKIEGILFCPHGPEDHCECRKPKSGLFEELEKTLKLSLKGAPAIGDSWRDLEASSGVEATPILVKTGKGMKTLVENSEALQTILVADCLAEAVDEFILSDPGLREE